MTGRIGSLGLVVVGLTCLQPAAELPAQSLVITGGTVHTVTGPPLENGIVIIRDGRIVAVGPAATIRPPGDATMIDASGRIVTPGFIDAATQLGLVEVGAVAATRDGSLNDGANRARFRASDGINPRSMLFAVARIDGVTNAISAPSGGVVSGQGAALTLAGSTRDEVLLDRSIALYATLGPGASGSAGGSRGGVVLALREALDEAREAAADHDEARRQFEVGAGEEPDPLDPDVAPVVAALAGEIPLVIRASGTPDIEMALELQEEYGFRLVIDGGEEAWILADRLAERGVPVMIRALENRPTRFDRLATRYEAPGILAAAGVSVILTTRSSHRVGQISHEAGNAIRYGMEWMAALRAVTVEPARAFGLDDLGTLEAGARANVVIWSDDPFEFSGYAERVFIDGREIEMESRQRQLFERYRRTP
ncbi:MAG: amidohydrolase family protein [Gemmatimonadota bacterium]|nr:amidohydrolase family protein [Gemmatimonadota bacterium]